MKKILLALCLLHAHSSAAADTFDEARAAALTRPAETIALFEAQLPVLSDTPAWYQRDWLVLSARAYTRLQRFSEAEHNLRRADALLNAGLSKTDLLLAAGFVNFMQQKYPAAFYWYQCSARFDLPPVEQARVDMSLGQISYIQGDFAKATAHFEQSLAAATLYKQPALVALLQNNLGLVLWRQQQYQPALKQLRQAMYGYTQLQERYSLQMASLNLLTVVVSQQDWPAFDRYARSISSTIDKKAPAELQHYLALLQALRKTTRPVPPADLQQLQQLAAPLRIPGLVQNAALLLQQAGAGSGITPAPALNPQQDLRLPQLEQQCGPYVSTSH
jgi:tetratricopeptide (TPR) repeat protein